jgi:hypothetical protein
MNVKARSLIVSLLNQSKQPSVIDHIQWTTTGKRVLVTNEQSSMISSVTKKEAAMTLPRLKAQVRATIVLSTLLRGE